MVEAQKNLERDITEDVGFRSDASTRQANRNRARTRFVHPQKMTE